MTRLLAFLYGVLCYLIFLATFLYLIGFIGNLVVPKSIDSGIPGSFALALTTNLVLIGIFGIQHSVMARPGFKQWWKRFIPPSIERSSYVLFASAALILMFWLWKPITQEVWHIRMPVAVSALWVMFALGWGVVLSCTFLIDHFDLFGLRQVYLNLKQRNYSPVGFREPFFYRLVRHPLMLGFIISFWAAPVMTVGRLIFAAGMTGYILIALQFEERDMVTYFGEEYRKYRQRVPMLVPWHRRRHV
ncbi:isoprenylcysteine carboxylmethyltransferase family protein [Dyella humi]|uniref:methanethiol S-methyltransferase n=2 Tax=Dyella humi TaxID=1770547 RepID=A0ABW8IMF1_9GAMM